MPEQPAEQESSTKAPERRSDPRFPFIGTAEVTELESGMHVRARTTDLSHGGCYVDSMTALETGTRVQIRITDGRSTFEARGRVRYAQPGIGMGIAFEEMSAAQHAILAGWIQSLSGAIAPLAEPGSAMQAGGYAHGALETTFKQLIALMVRKRLLTAPEGAELLRELQGTTRDPH